MSYLIRQRANLSTQVRNKDGQLTDTTASLVLTRPDGTTVTPTVSHDGVGLYSADVTFDQAGDWLRVWSTTGTVVSVDSGQVHVVAPALQIVGLDEVKAHGNITGTQSDNELLDFIGAAQRMIEAEIGPVVRRTVTGEVHPTYGYAPIMLDLAPVLSVTSVQEVVGTTTNAPLAAGLYELDGESGMLTRMFGGVQGYWSGREAVVSYVAGRAVVAENVRLAAKELIIHLWRSTQNMRGGRGRGAGEPEAAAGPAGFAMPNRVREMLAGEALSPIGVA